MRYLCLISIICLSVFASLNAQEITGVVENENGERLFGATIQWEGTSIGTVADENGTFTLVKQDTTTNLEINYVGYEAILIPVEAHENEVFILLSGITDLMEVEVAAKVRDNYVSTLETLNIESIGVGEFRKAACCNLAESFSTNASVDLSFSDAITGAKEIQLLGLRGAYTQMLIEKRPSLAGLGSAFAMEYIPGTWLSSIQISKGTSTVQNGYQGIAGQINSELVKPYEDKAIYINLYGSTFGRGEANIHLNKKINKEWSTGLLLHASTRHNNVDGNNDGYFDTSQKDLLDAMYRLFYRGDILRAQFNIHALRDVHSAGQIIPDNADPADFYKINQENNRVELFGKIGYLGFKKPYNSLGFITNMSWHDLDAIYGNKIHQGTERNFYANLMYATIIGTTDHKWNMGASYIFDDYKERFSDANYDRIERVPGVFGEYSYSIGEVLDAGGQIRNKQGFKEKIGIVAGVRLDHHNQYGWLFTPRLNLKYNFSDNSIVRLSAGRGFRTVNVIAENIGLLASSRDIILWDELDMEDAWNFGVNFVQKFNLGVREGSIAIDAYRTQFDNQVIMDREHDIRQVVFYNLRGRSFSNSLLAVLSYDLIEGLEMKLAYKMNDVKIDFVHGFEQKPFVSRHRGLITLDYETKDEAWNFNTSVQMVGKQRFPDNSALPDDLEENFKGFSPAYAIWNGQISRTFKNWELYVGVENITGYTQQNAIIDWENPFGDYFDATQVYAPVSGTMGYIGLRIDIDEGEKKDK